MNETGRPDHVDAARAMFFALLGPFVVWLLVWLGVGWPVEVFHLAQQSANMKFLERPPLTLDDQLDYKVTRLAGGVPLVASTFENMTSATAGLALRLEGVPQEPEESHDGVRRRSRPPSPGSSNAPRNSRT